MLNRDRGRRRDSTGRAGFRLPVGGLGFALGGALLSFGATGIAESTALRDELQALAAEHGIRLEGLDRVGSDPAQNAEGSVADRLRRLLEDYNYVLVQDRPGVVTEVRISSRKRLEATRSSDRAYVDTVRIGTHHQVEATITGPNGVSKTVALIVDTGASSVVLPDSMIPELGFAPEYLQEGTSQAAGGPIPVKIGILSSVRVGAVAAGNIQVAFIANGNLGDTKLLGMSFLQHFRMTIDDGRNELILLAK